jgi:hypothetical protein
MKRNFVRTVLLATLLLGLAASGSAQQWGSCSAAMVAGTWGYTLTGSLIPPTGAVPYASVGQFTVDMFGNVSGERTVSANGTIVPSTIKGTATVNSDCTGTLTEGFYDQTGKLLGNSVKAVVYTDNGREARAIVTSVLQPNGASVPAVLTMSARKLFVAFAGMPW